MPKAGTSKRKSHTSEVVPNAKRQRAGDAPKTPKKRAQKVKNASAAKATQKPAEGDASRRLTLQDLPDNVLASVFCALGIDRLRAMQGKEKGPPAT